MTLLRERMTEDMQIRNLALNTQISYVQQVSLFARHFNKSPEALGPEDIGHIRCTSRTRRSWPPVPFSPLLRHCVSYTRSLSKRTGLLRTSSPRQRNRKSCPLFSVRRKSLNFSTRSEATSTG